jgi:hypothetical protein
MLGLLCPFFFFFWVFFFFFFGFSHLQRYSLGGKMEGGGLEDKVMN